MYDVCVIGSGPAGGVLAKELAEAGAKVALIEAGGEIPPDNYHYHAWPYERPYRGFRDAHPDGAYPPEVTEAIRYENCDRIGVDRIRAVGGRSLHWNADCFRFAERDFRERTLAGVEEDWPLSYQELAPLYSYVEKMIGVCGTREKLGVVPDGEYLPPLKFRCSEMIVKRACAKMGISVIPTRRALLTVPYDGRPPCHYCGHCMDGCDVGAIFTVPNSMLPKARKTGNFTLISRKLARELRVDPAGKVRAISVIDTATRREEEIPGRLFAVCCGAVETPRLLLNSRSPQFPEGIANSNDSVGRYLTGHITADFYAYLEDLVGTGPVNNDGANDHSYIPRFNLDGKKRDYAGGYQYQLQDWTFMIPHHAPYLKGFGKKFKQQVRFLQPGYLYFDCYAKVLARPENRVTVDSNHRDAYGVPIPVVHFKFAENDILLWKEMRTKAREILDVAKVRLVIDADPGPTGFASHEAGTARMGKDPRTSVLNSYCQAHEVKNLFVVGGASFTTFPEKNPTLTIMALAVRAARYMSSEIRKGNL